MSKTEWLEVSLTVDGELAEAVADILARFLPNGVVIESTEIAADADHPAGRVVGPLRVFGYLPMDDQLEEKRQRLEESLWYLGRIRPLSPPQFRPVEEVDWAETWKQHYRPIPIGRKLIIVPAWMESPVEDRIPIHIDPGMAFGTGTHPTTQICLEFIEELLIAPGANTALSQVIDVGCGSGILSIAALKLGAEAALGVDTDPDAIQAARQNAVNNAVAERLMLERGSLAEIQAGKFPISKAPLVLANILAHILVKLLDEGLEMLLAEDGKLVLSGILQEQVEGVETALQQRSLQVVERRQVGDWVALCAARAGSG